MRAQNTWTIHLRGVNRKKSPFFTRRDHSTHHNTFLDWHEEKRDSLIVLRRCMM